MRWTDRPVRLCEDCREDMGDRDCRAVFCWACAARRQAVRQRVRALRWYYRVGKLVRQLRRRKERAAA